LSDITSRIETFFLAGTEAGAETEIETGVLLAVEIFGIAGTIGIVGIAEKAGAGAGTGVFGIEAFSSRAWLNKDST
jgi:hypothetical protein